MSVDGSEVVSEQNSQTVAADNSYLSIMRVGVEGISPDFDKNIMEYTLVVGDSVSDLNITALPENSDSKVNIYGNKGMRAGLNKVQIEVVSKDGTQKRTYVINVTKTSTPQKANANLQTLAVEYFDIEPDFSANTTSYKVNVPSNIEKVNILAIPESMAAKVNMDSIEKLEFGDNTINVKVTAEDGITVKRYILKVHRRTAEEDTQAEAEEADNAKKLNDAIKLANSERLSETQKVQNKNNPVKTVFIVALVATIAITVIVLIVKKKIRFKE